MGTIRAGNENYRNLRIARFSQNIEMITKMKTTLEEMAYGYACNRLVPDAQCDNSAEITNLQVMFADFAKKVLEERERWRDPEKELPEDGATVLGKTSDVQYPFVIVRYIGCRWLVWAFPGWGGVEGGILGWRPILENM